MESFTDHGIVLSARGHGEGGAIVALLTESNGRHAGYVHGGQSSKKRGMLEPGSAVKVEWRSRVAESLGTYTMEPDRGIPAGVMDDPLKLGALMSACALCDSALPEREGHAGLYYGLQALIAALGEEHWGPVYVMWEIALLKELGFGLDLTRCAGGGDSRDLTHVSPKSGRAVSAAVAGPYVQRMLELPGFLKPGGGEQPGDMVTGLRLTAHFLEHWVFAHHTKGVPEARGRFQERVEKTLGLQ
jgi:DNA repair protein RecO (recombination protein O)